MKNDLSYQFAVVKWLDHVSGEEGWTQMAMITTLQPIEVWSAGWIMRETKDFLTLVPHCGVKLDGNLGEICRGELCILKKVILQRYNVPKYDR